jgi:hypothetical protein
MDNNRPIFVVGCPRSGTTMLQLMLHAHPRIAIPPETRFLLTAYAERVSFGDLTDAANRRSLAERITHDTTSFPDLGLDAGEVIDEIMHGPPTLGSAMGIVFRAYAHRFGKPRWGDKRPAYLNNIEVILRLFPDAQIINIIRDGRDCVASLRETPWYRKEICHAISAWSRAMDNSQRAKDLLSPDSYYEVRYEQLVSEPERELRSMCRFLREDYHPAMSEPATVASVAVPSRKTWHRLTHSPVTTDRTGSWRQRLEPWEIALCDATIGAKLTTMGYQPSGSADSVWRGQALPHQLHYFLLDAHRWTAGPRRAFSTQQFRLRPPEILACQLSSAAPVSSAAQGTRVGPQSRRPLDQSRPGAR